MQFLYKKGTRDKGDETVESTRSSRSFPFYLGFKEEKPCVGDVKTSINPCIRVTLMYSSSTAGFFFYRKGVHSRVCWNSS